MSARPSEGPATEIRPAKPADLDAIASIEAASFNMDAFSRRTLGRLLRSASVGGLVAKDEAGRAVGYAMVLFRRGARVARLYTIATAPEARGTGVAAALIEAAAAAAQARGCDRFRLELRAGNEAARRLYDRAGFKELSIKPEYYKDGEAAAVMERPLHRNYPDGRGVQL